MFKVSIIKNGQMTHCAQFETQGELDAWLAKHVAQNTFGLAERAEVVVNEEGIEVLTGVILPAEYSIVQEDISAQMAQEEANKQAQELLDSTDWKVLRHRDQMELGIGTSLTNTEFQNLLQERQAARNSIVR